MSVPKRNFEGHFTTYVFGSRMFCHVRKLKVGCCTSCHLLWKNVLNYFEWVEVRILVGKWNKYEAHIFTRSLVQKCWLETTTLCLNSRLRVNKIFYILNIYIEIYVTLRLLCAQPLISRIIFRTPGSNIQDNVNYVLDFMLFLMFIFRILMSWKTCFSHISISFYVLGTKEFRV